MIKEFCEQGRSGRATTKIGRTKGYWPSATEYSLRCLESKYGYHPVLRLSRLRGHSYLNRAGVKRARQFKKKDRLVPESECIGPEVNVEAAAMQRKQRLKKKLCIDLTPRQYTRTRKILSQQQIHSIQSELKNDIDEIESGKTGWYAPEEARRDDAEGWETISESELPYY
jgi:hypothetical protein